MSKVAAKTLQLGSSATLSQNIVLSVPAVQDGSMTIKREDGTSLLTIGANGKWVAPGLIGTVSQSGGVPTGQIIERGGNVNGEYVRFADGTQICTLRTATLPTGATAYGTGGLTRYNLTWTFPAVFSNSGMVISGGGQDNIAYGILAGGTETSNTTATNIAYVTTNGAVSSVAINLLAIGRWF